MRKLATAWALTTVLALSPAAAYAKDGFSTLPVDPGPVNKGQPETPKESGLKLELKSDTKVQAGEPVKLEAVATNTTNADMALYLPTPCHSPFRLTVTSQNDQSIAAMGGADPQVICIQVIQPLHIGAGESLKHEFTWETRALATGSYTLKVEFAAHGLGDAGLPAAAVTVSVIGSDDVTPAPMPEPVPAPMPQPSPQPIPMPAPEPTPEPAPAPEPAPVPLPAPTPVPIPLPAPVPPVLADIAGHWAEANLSHAIAIGLLKGDDQGKINPNKQITRAEFVTILARALGLEVKTQAESSFGDANGHWVHLQGYLEAAVEAGLVHPADYGFQFGPDEVISRQEITLVLVRAIGMESEAVARMGAELSFADAGEVPAWAAGYLTVAQEANLVSGMPGNRFDPKGKATRAEAITFALRLKGYLQGN